MMIPKFRAWDEKNHEFFISGSDGTLSNLVCCDDWDMFNPDDYVWEQSTGIKDVNGNEIYEGDILEFGSVWLNGDESDPQEEDHTGIVEYHPEYASYVVNCNEMIYPLEQMASFDGYSVRGNVHENPELLEAQHD